MAVLDKKPSLPELTPTIGVPVSLMEVIVSSIVPSPPILTKKSTGLMMSLLFLYTLALAMQLMFLDKRNS